MDTNFSEINYQPFLESLDKLGFCTFPVFGKSEIAQLFHLYQDNFGDKQINSLYASHNSNPVEKGLLVNREIKKIVSEKLQTIFPNYDYFVGHFMVKGEHVSKEFPLHQDWNIVDESKFKSYQVWIPLQLTYPANGGMFVVPGSHKFFNNFRSGSYGKPLIPFDEKFKPIVSDVIVPAGNVLFYQNALFHASHGNTTGEKRITAIVNIVEKKAPTYYFHKNISKNVTELYSINGETLIQNLPLLEKGIVDDGLPLAGTTHIDITDNENMQPEELVAAYRKHFGNAPAGQVKQLHIAVYEKLEQELNERGYTVIDLLTEQEVEVFRSEYFAMFGNIDRRPGRFTTLQSTDTESRNIVHRFIRSHVDRPLRKFFKDFDLPVSIFYTKKAHTSGDIELHADSTLLLNHQLEPHYAIWIPLLDVGENNGTLTVVPGSHKVRGAFFGGSMGGYHYEIKDWLHQFEVPLHMRAGQAVVFDNNLLHNSTANKTDTDRICVTFRLTHINSQYYNFHCADRAVDSFEMHKVSHNFYMDEQWKTGDEVPEQMPDGIFINSLTKVKKDDLEKILKEY